MGDDENFGIDPGAFSRAMPSYALCALYFGLGADYQSLSVFLSLDLL
jgi:hypothetical protein